MLLLIHNKSHIWTQKGGEFSVVNMNKLNGAIAERDFNKKILSEKTGIAYDTLCKKFRNKPNNRYYGLFSIEEADLIANALGLSANEATNIFFSQYVA